MDTKILPVERGVPDGAPDVDAMTEEQAFMAAQNVIMGCPNCSWQGPFSDCIFHADDEGFSCPTCSYRLRPEMAVGMPGSDDDRPGRTIPDDIEIVEGDGKGPLHPGTVRDTIGAFVADEIRIFRRDPNGPSAHVMAIGYQKAAATLWLIT